MRRFSVLGLVLSLTMVTMIACSATSGVRSQWDYRVFTSGEPNSVEYSEEGFLFYRERLVKPVFSVLLCPIGAYVYRQQQPLNNSSSGWMKDFSKQNSFDSPEAGSPLGTEDLLQGWYFASWDERRPGTPIDWIWVAFETNGYWIKPQGLLYYSEILAPPRQADP